jgi:hypothetical protein
MAEAQLALYRVIRGEHVAGGVLPIAPNTTNADIAGLASFWAMQLGSLPDSVSQRTAVLVSLWWDALLPALELGLAGAPRDVCLGNDAFWAALIGLCRHTELGDVALAAPSVRNADASAVTSDDEISLDAPKGTAPDDLARIHRDRFAAARGVDDVNQPVITRVPRTQIRDVRRLAKCWTHVPDGIGMRSFSDRSYLRALDSWSSAVADVERIPATADPNEVYPHNAAFWQALYRIAIQIAVTAEAPTRWDIVKDVAADGAHAVGAAADATVHAVGGVLHTLAQLPHLVPDAIDHAIDDAERRLLGRPLLYAGLGVGGVLLTIYLVSRWGSRE